MERRAAARPRGRPRKSPPEQTGGDATGHGGDGTARQALLGAADRILRCDGIQALTLRAAAREAGVSHAAPKNHFGDLAGLLSALAATGFRRLAATMQARVRPDMSPAERLCAIGRGYVEFALADPAHFLLMFRSERLDFTRPELAAASRAAFETLTGTIAAQQEAAGGAADALARIARTAAAWGQVHGLAMLLIDGRLGPLLASVEPPIGMDRLLAALFAEPPPGR